RPVLEAPTYAEARALAVELTGKSVSAQSYALRHRILEVDEHARRDERVIEVHPEVSFSELARRPLLSKHRTDGLAERRALLEEAGIEVPESVPRIASRICSTPPSPPGPLRGSPGARRCRSRRATKRESARSGARLGRAGPVAQLVRAADS